MGFVAAQRGGWFCVACFQTRAPHTDVRLFLLWACIPEAGICINYLLVFYGNHVMILAR